jgi:hypothetical protein
VYGVQGVAGSNPAVRRIHYDHGQRYGNKSSDAEKLISARCFEDDELRCFGPESLDQRAADVRRPSNSFAGVETRVSHS